MGTINPPLPTLGQPNSTEDADILSALTALVNLVNGSLDTANTGNRFLQLATIADRKVGFGQNTVTFPGGVPNSNANNVTHGLGRTPQTVIVTPISGLAWIVFDVIDGTVSSTQFNVIARAVDGATPTGTKKFFWVAIG